MITSDTPAAVAHTRHIDPDRGPGGPVRLDGRPAGTAPTGAGGETRSPRRQVRLPEDLDKKLNAYCAIHDTTASAVLREAVSLFLDDRQED